MATIDSRIPLAFQAPQINSPAQNKLAALAVQGKEMELQQAQRGMQNQNRLAQYMGSPSSYTESGSINPSIIPEIAAFDPQAAMGLRKEVREDQKALTAQQLAQIDLTKKDMELGGMLLNGVVDEPTWQKAKQLWGAAGKDLSSLPANFDPVWVSQTKQQTQTVQQQIENFFKEQGLSLQQQRLDLDRNMPRGQVVDTAQGVMIVDPRSGASRPAVGADSQPVLGERAAQAQKQQRERQVEAIEARQAVDNSAANLDRLISEAQGIIKDPALKRITGIAGTLPNWPGGEAADVQARLETLKSQAGFAVLQAMRDASKTGGALGNVSNFEVQALQNNLAALDTRQSPEAFVSSLKQIVDYANGVKARMSDAYQQQYGGSNPAQPQATQQQTPRSDDGIPTISSPQQLQSLPSGTVFRAPDGSLRKVP